MTLADILAGLYQPQFPQQQPPPLSQSLLQATIRAPAFDASAPLQNAPMAWGLADVLSRRADTMKDPGRWGEAHGEKIRRDTEDYEINVLRRLFGNGNGWGI